MKIQLTALANHWKRKWPEEKEIRDKSWIFFLVFCCSSNVFFRWLRLHSYISGIRSLFGAHPKIGASTFGCLHIIWSSTGLIVYDRQIPLFYCILSLVLSKRLSRFLFQPIRACCQFPADIFLFLCWASLIILTIPIITQENFYEKFSNQFKHA